MRWLLDTNVLIDAFAGRTDAVKAITIGRKADLEWIGYSAVTRLEALGFSGLTAADELGLRSLLGQYLAKRQSTRLLSSERSKSVNPCVSKYRMRW